jgi:hypothetical protein
VYTAGEPKKRYALWPRSTDLIYGSAEERERRKDYRCDGCGWMRATKGYPARVRIEGGIRVGVCDKCFLRRAQDVRRFLSEQDIRTGRGRKAYWDRPLASLWIGMARASGATPSEIAAATGLNRTTVWRLLAKPSVEGGAAALSLVFEALSLDQVGDGLPAPPYEALGRLPAPSEGSPFYWGFHGKRELRVNVDVSLASIDRKMDARFDALENKVDDLRALLNTFLGDLDDDEAAQAVEDFIDNALSEAA